MNTRHGYNIAAQIAGDDASGEYGTLTQDDIFEIIDQIHTNLMDGGVDESPVGLLIVQLLNQMSALNQEAASNG